MSTMHDETEHPTVAKVCDYIKERRKRRKRLLKELFLDFAKNTTLHGLRYTTEKGLQVIEKVFWLITFHASVCISFYFIYEAWWKWSTSPVIVSFNQKFISVDEIPFPSVTVCPEMKFKQSVFNYTQFMEGHYLCEHGRLKNEHCNLLTSRKDKLANANALGLICDTKRSFGVAKNLDHFAVKRLHALSVNYTDILRSWTWLGTKSNGDERVKRVLTKEGVCYNFNGLAAHEILRVENLQREYNYTFHTAETKDWSLTKGYASKNKMAYPFRGTEGNGAPTLSMELNFFENERDTSCNRLYSGYNIYLHHPGDLPQALTYHFTANLDQLTSLAVKVSIRTTSNNLKSYPVELRQCYFPEDRSLKFFRVYTYNNCKLECLTDYTYRKCGCVAFYMPFDDSKLICSGRLMEECVSEAEGLECAP
ncbi:pickpocket protein 28-like [Ostrinia furnacalis]|uniref:pickpocket protein 28-like n=1 Tax=Ostrinia furnacalis TaxID=93504 RepID=UPI00103D5D44|nr:pickpocket protein 28-like [Ostrinia furnacalis]